MLQIENETPFRAALAPMADEDGIDSLFVCIKGTFALRPRLQLADEQLPIATVDRHLGDPASSSLAEAGDLHLGKAGTDVVLHGCAHVDNGRPVPSSSVAIQIAERSKSIAVYGDRQWKSFDRVSSPQPFVEMPLVYERAFGGIANAGDRTAREIAAFNPVGVGLDRRTGAPVPNLEDPRAPIEGGGGRPRVACFAPVAPGWQPRSQYAGTYDAGWKRRRAPLLPKDFDKRFFNVAAPELAFDRFLQGNEPVTVVGASRMGPIDFAVPRCDLFVEGYIADAWRTAPVVLETIAIWTELDRVSLTWRAKLDCDRTILRAECVRITVTAMPAGVA